MKVNKSPLAQANEAFRSKDYNNALRLYIAAQKLYPELKTIIDKNIENTRKHIALSAPKHLEISNKTTIDIVVPVYNALDDVKKCLTSLSESTDDFKVNIIVVNDGSDEQTTLWLRDFCKHKPLFTLIENPKNFGYTKTVNVGLKASTADYVITQNSDTIVSKGWLVGLVNCINSDPKIGICGPLSNAASWQNVPDLYDETRKFAVNSLPPQFTVSQMAQVVKEASLKIYPQLPFVNGFCFMIKREVLNKVGYMDEENFPIGYGEENDYCIRAQDAGYKLAIADDVYVYHAKSKSFGHEKRQNLSSKGTENLKRKHSEEKYIGLVSKVKDTSILDQVRSRIKDNLSILSNLGLTNQKQELNNSLKILFLLPVKGGGGGAHSVVQEVTAMRKLGISAYIGIKHEQLEGFLNNYKDIPDSGSLFICFDENSIYDLAANYDVVIGTIFNSMQIVKKISEVNPHILPAYYVQDYEPMFFEPGSLLWQQAYDSYNLVPQAFLFAKTQWIVNKVYQEHKVAVHKVSPSIDHEVYKPIFKSKSSDIHIVAMIRPNTAYRGAERTMRVLSKLNKIHGRKLKIHIFGCLENAKEFQLLERNFDYENHEILTRPKVAELLSNCDIFIDLSDYQAFGRTALEAMACGCAAVVPLAGGADEYAVHQKNAFIVNTLNEQECYEVINQAILNTDKLVNIKNNGLLTAAKYSVHQASVSEYIALSEAQKRHIVQHPKIKKNTLFLIPTIRKDNLLAGSGFVRVGLPYNSAKIRKAINVKTVDYLPINSSNNKIIIQRDAARYSINELRDWCSQWQKTGGKLIYEVDDDLLNYEGMIARGYKGNYSELSQKVAFLAQSADLITVSTANLAKKFESFNSNIQVIPNLLDDDLWQISSQRNHILGEYGRKPNGVVRIGYIGTGTHDADLEMIAPAMQAIQKKYGDKVEIEVIGGFQNKSPLFGQRVGLPKKNDYPNFVKWLLQRVHWDIGIIPLVDDEFNKSKSNLKFLEYAALDMAIVVSDAESYRNIARHNENCLVVSSDKESWVDKLSLLVEDEFLRNKLSSNARKDLINNYTLSGQFTLFNKVLNF